jgi:L-alanine-DL-glutamate epimerase-like enolase superfamily enzyme
MRQLVVRSETWPLAESFRIARGAKTEAQVVVVELAEGGRRGRGECVPYGRYGETVAGVVQAIETLRGPLTAGLDRRELQQALPAGAARNALDCALWDLQAKRAATPVWQLAGLPAPAPLTTAFTLSVAEPQAVERRAREQAHRPLLKLKLAGQADRQRVAAARRGAPCSRLIVDANESWTIATFVELSAELSSLGVAVIEQPLPAGRDEALAHVAHPVPVCADESVHDRATLGALAGRYEMINLKLDKTGGLTEALALRQAAQRLGFEVMVGCMVSTSLSLAPAVLLAQGAALADLDGGLLLAADRPEGLRYEGSTVHPPSAELWG